MSLSWIGRMGSSDRKEKGRTFAEFMIDEKQFVDPNMVSVDDENIGERAHGNLHEGRYNGKNVAVKVFNSEIISEECRANLESCFTREVTMMSKVTHDNVVKLIGACKDPSMIIMELPGMSLQKYLHSIRPKQLDVHVALNYALDIAQGMECLHENGIIHRNLKPGNVLLTEDLKSVKLGDFGFAREETNESMTAETGTYGWMAPELYNDVTLRKGEKTHYTNKVDVYSFGILFGELLMNRWPFDTMTNLQAAFAAFHKDERPIIADETPAYLAFIISICWHKDPKKRPCFSEIIHMLNAYQASPESCNATIAVRFSLLHQLLEVCGMN